MTEKTPQTDAQVMENKLRLMETDRKNHFESSQVSIKQNNEVFVNNPSLSHPLQNKAQK